MSCFASRPASIESLDYQFTSRYDIVEEIGIGGSGVVYKVVNEEGRIFAAKVIAKDRLRPQALLKTRQWGLNTYGLSKTKDGAVIVPTEAYILRRLNHGGTIGFVELLACESFFYLIMEFHGRSWASTLDSLPPSPPATPPWRQLDLTGCPISPTGVHLPSTITPPSFVSSSPKTSNLRAPLMRRSSSDLFDAIEVVRRFSEPAARYIFHQIVATVCDLAQVGIRHNDLKDENIVLDERLQVKLIDFGSAILWDTSKPAPLQSGRFCGTSSFASPEAFSPETPYDGEAAEVWALGVILCLLLTGSHPFARPEDARFGFLARFKVPISPLAYDCIRKCLTVDSKRRIRLHDLLNHPWILEN
ncbi:uncharacterized protein JCM6883_006090 [Sporobolomyces salmoneus]|uniref:uncharacterized protein n=1 Tax=Sporobolomyces salmoneus TaxID=183962 RepID=UPI00316C3B9B